MYSKIGLITDTQRCIYSGTMLLPPLPTHNYILTSSRPLGALGKKKEKKKMHVFSAGQHKNEWFCDVYLISSSLIYTYSRNDPPQKGKIY
ncbi:hypothetical protein FKM82_007665 [Ascaphus truei]